MIWSNIKLEKANSYKTIHGEGIKIETPKQML